jgi:hypothetical protein
MVVSLSSLTRAHRRARSQGSHEDRISNSYPAEVVAISDPPDVPPVRPAPDDGTAGTVGKASTAKYRPPFEIEPYEQYIRLAYLEAGWPEPGEWPNGVIVTCGFQAVELLMILARDAMADDRPTAPSNGLLERIVEVTASAFLELGRALAGSMPPKFARTEQAHRYNSSMEAVVKMMPRHHRVRLEDTFVEAFGTLGYRTGIEHVFTGKRHRSVPCLDYAALVAPSRMIDLQSRPLNGPEDRLFATVHQIAECWLNIVHLQVGLALELGGQGDWQRAAIQTRRASSAVALVTQVCRLLDAMVLSDYHCLRVQLRDGSGAQSMKARALSAAGRGLYDALNRAMTAEGTTLMCVLDEPGKYLDFHDQQAALQDFGRRCQAFLFEHYLLALSILGADNLGSLGFPVFMLAKRAAQPFFPDVNQVKHDYTIITNFRYARRAGAIVLENELRSSPDAYADLSELESESCPPDVIRRVSREYFTCIENHDAEGWMSLFHPDAWLLDAPESRPFKGPDRLRVFVDSMFDRLTDMRVTSLEISVGKNSSEIDWSFTAVALSVPVSFSGRETLSFTDDGRILHASIHWNQAELSEQIWRGKTASCTAPTEVAPIDLSDAVGQRSNVARLRLLSSS